MAGIRQQVADVVADAAAAAADDDRGVHARAASQPAHR